jgi:hypothetical protein
LRRFNSSAVGSGTNNPLGNVKTERRGSIDVLKNASATAIYLAGRGDSEVTTKGKKRPEPGVARLSWAEEAGRDRTPVPTCSMPKQYIGIKNEQCATLSLNTHCFR